MSKPKERLKKIQSSHSKTMTDLKPATWTTLLWCINPPPKICHHSWNRLLWRAPPRLTLYPLEISSPLMLIMQRSLKSIWALNKIKVSSTQSKIWMAKMGPEVTWEIKSPSLKVRTKTFKLSKMTRSYLRIARSLLTTSPSRAKIQSMSTNCLTSFRSSSARHLKNF